MAAGQSREDRPLSSALAPLACGRRQDRETGKAIGALVRVQGVEQKESGFAGFAEFYESARDDCLRIVLMNVGDGQLAEDLVAEAFTRAWVSWRKVRQHPAPRAWVIRTALNAHVSWWRRRRREVPLGDHDTAAPAGADGVLDTALVAALQRLPARQREVVTLRLLLDLDTVTTAKTMGIAPGTVSAHLHHAVAALRGEIPYPGHQEVSK